MYIRYRKEIRDKYIHGEREREREGERERDRERGHMYKVYK